MTLQTHRYDPAMFIKTHEDLEIYLNEAYRDNDPKVFLMALSDVAKIQGILEISKKTGLNTESLNKALSGETEPSWDIVQRIMKSLDIHLKAAA